MLQCNVNLIHTIFMKKLILPLLAVLFLSLIIAVPAHTQTLSDISGHANENAIQELVDLGIINGYSDGTYKPNLEINRAEFLKIVIGAFKGDVGNNVNCFPDVKTEWFAKYICYGKNNQIIEGYPDNYFRPAQTVNYVEALKMLYQANNDSGNAYGNQWYSKYLDDAIANDIAIKGLEPSHSMKRGEIAQLVSNYANKKEVSLQEVPAQQQPAPVTETSPESTPSENTSTYDGDGSVGVDLINCENAQITGNAIYVATNGNDSNDGSLENPLRTVHTALEGIASNTTVVLRGGTYAETQELRIRVPNVTIRSMPGEWAVIDRSSSMDDIGVYFYVGSDGGKLQCVEVTGGFYAFATETMWDWGESDRSGASNILIEDSKLHGSARDVIKIKPNSDYITIRRSEIYNSGKDLSRENCNAEGIDNVNGDGMVVQNNHIYNICSNGVYMKGGATNGMVENNLIEDTGASGIIIGFDTSPEYFDLTVNPTYYENISGTVRNNLIKDTGWGGIALYASKDAQVYNNTLINTAKTYHSPIYFGITFQDWEPEAGRPANVNPTIRNNVVSQSSALDAPIISIRQTEELGGLSGLAGGVTMSGNCYYQAGGQARFKDDRTQVDQGGWIDDWTGDLTEWKSHIGSDSNSIESNPNLDSDNLATGQCAGKGYSK